MPKIHLVLVLLLVCCGVALADPVWKSTAFDTSDSKTMQVRVVEATSGSTMLEYTIPGFYLDEKVIEGKNCSVIFMPAAGATDELGLPEMPRLFKDLLIGPTGSVQFTILNQVTQVFEVALPVPSKGRELTRDINPDSVPYVFKSFKIYPETVFSLSEPSIFRDVRLVNARFLPFQYDSEKGQLTVTTKMTVNVENTRDSGINELPAIRTRINSAFQDIYQNHFLNAPATSDRAGHDIEDKGSILIITAPQFKADMSPFVTHKQSRGHAVEMVDTDQIGGNTVNSIQNKIRSSFEAGCAYVILVGDAEHVATKPGTAGNVANQEADPTYALLRGSDQYPDLFISRISVSSSADVTVQVNKFIKYETAGVKPYHASLLSIASAEGSPTDKFRLTEHVYKPYLKTYYPTHYTQYDGEGASSSGVKSAIERGVGYINYCGHGSITSWATTGFSNSHIGQLANRDMLPFIISVACVNGKFRGYTCFGETWLRKLDGGAVACFASSTNQAWVPPCIGQKRIAECISTKKARTIGALCTYGSIAVIEYEGGGANQTFQSWHLFGDASLVASTPVN